MKPLFETNLRYNGHAIAYEVYFEKEAYVFQPAQNDFPVIKLKREDDEWHSDESIDGSLRATAISELEHYLLSQH